MSSKAKHRNGQRAPMDLFAKHLGRHTGKRCRIWTFLVPSDEAECTLPWNHTGPHAYKRTGKRVAFGPDGRHWVRIPADELEAA